MKFAWAMVLFVLLIFFVFWSLIRGIRYNESLSPKEKLNHVPDLWRGRSW